MRTLSQGFELTDATDWYIGKVTRGNRDGDVAFLVTDGGCSCFISVAQGHFHQAGKFNEFEALMRSLLHDLSHVSVLIHYSANDISRDVFTPKQKRVVSINEISHRFQRLEHDTRYVIKGIEGSNL